MIADWGRRNCKLMIDDRKLMIGEAAAAIQILSIINLL
jgi:hypothetical protein